MSLEIGHRHFDVVVTNIPIAVDFETGRFQRIFHLLTRNAPISRNIPQVNAAVFAIGFVVKIGGMIV